MKEVLVLWLTFGLGVTVALYAAGWNKIKKISLISHVIGVLLSVPLWPVAIWNNRKWNIK